MKTLAFFTAFDGIMWGRKCQRKDICTLSVLSGASDLYAEVFGETGAGRYLHHGRLAYLAVTLLVQEARFVKRFYVRRLTNNGAINFNGCTITLADGTVLR